MGALWDCRKALALQQGTYKTLIGEGKVGKSNLFDFFFPYEKYALETWSCKRQGELKEEGISTRMFMNEGKKKKVES